MSDGARLSFIVHYDDPQAGIVRQYQLCYFTSNDTIEMHDVKNRRIFLKRCSYPQVTMSDLFIGATITVHARKLSVVRFADDATKQVYQVQAHNTCVIITPEGYEKLGQVLSAVAAAGLRVVRMNMLRLTDQEAEDMGKIDESAGAWGGQPLLGCELAGPDAHDVWQRAAAEPGIAGCSWSPADPGASAQLCEWLLYDPERRGRSSAALHNCTLCIVKPHAVRAGYGGSILDTILDEGFEISALRLVSLTYADAEDFLEVYKGVVPEYVGLVEQLSSGPLWAAEIRAESAVKELRKLAGPHDPEVAKVLRPKSLRARFGDTRVCNAVHCTDLPEDGLLESDFFFDLVKQ